MKIKHSLVACRSLLKLMDKKQCLYNAFNF